MIVSCSACGAHVRIKESRLSDGARCPSCKGAVTPIGVPLPIETVEAFEELVAGSDLPVLVDFWAPWCGPCRMVAPELQKLAASRSGRVVIAKVNTDELPTLGSRFQITGIPTLALFREGREVARVSGAMPAEQIAKRFGL